MPIFQAQGLTVKTENSRYTPLFLAKEDLDVAVGAAFSQREAAKEVANKSKASAAEEDVASARATVRSPSASPTGSCKHQKPCDVAFKRQKKLSSAPDAEVMCSAIGCGIQQPAAEGQAERAWSKDRRGALSSTEGLTSPRQAADCDAMTVCCAAGCSVQVPAAEGRGGRAG